MEYSTGSDEEEDQDLYAVKTEATDKSFPSEQQQTSQSGRENSTTAVPATAPPSNTNGSTKQSISSIIDNPESTASPPPPSSETPVSASQEQATPVKEKVGPTEPCQSDREPSETKEAEAN